MTYSELAERLSLSESAVKRMFGLKDMSLVRLADICKAAEISMEDVLLESTSVTPRLATSPASKKPRVSVRRTHLDSTRLSLKDRVHLTFTWTRWQATRWWAGGGTAKS